MNFLRNGDVVKGLVTEVYDLVALNTSEMVMGSQIGIISFRLSIALNDLRNANF